MSENTQAPELTEEELEQLAALTGQDEAPQITDRCLLSLWEDVLGNVEKIGAEPINIHVAAKVVASWPFLTFARTARYHELYHEHLAKMREPLTKVISEHPEALKHTGEADAEENHKIYRDLLVSWHNYIEDLEVSWRAEDEDADVLVGILADLRAFFFSRMNMAGHLDAIGFSMDDDEFLSAVYESREEKSE